VEEVAGGQAEVGRRVAPQGQDVLDPVVAVVVEE